MSLINFDNIPNGMVSGLSSEELNFFSKESTERFVVELDRHLFDDLENALSGEEFKLIDDDVLREMDEAETEMTPESTRKQTEMYSKKFHDFLVSNNLSQDLKNVPESVLADYLRLFYFGLKRNDLRLFC